MINWIIVIAAIALIYFLVKIKHIQNGVSVTLVILLLLFVYISASVVISKNNIEVKSLDGMVTAGKVYFKWIGHVVDNTKTIIGNAIRMDWSAKV